VGDTEALFGMRLQTQQCVLDMSATVPAALRTIADDVDNQAALTYFAIDAHILSEKISATSGL
jgi:hypothetical protein